MCVAIYQSRCLWITGFPGLLAMPDVCRPAPVPIHVYNSADVDPERVRPAQGAGLAGSGHATDTIMSLYTP